MQLPGDRVGPERAEPTCDTGGDRKPASPPPRRSSDPGRRPPPASAPRPEQRCEGRPHKRGSGRGRGSGRRRPGGGLAVLPRAARRPATTPLPPSPARSPPPTRGARPARAPTAWAKRVGVEGRGRGPGPRRVCARGGAGSVGAAAAAPGIKLAPARPSRRRRGDQLPRRWGRRAGPEAARAGERREGLTEQPPRASAPSGPEGPAGGGGAAIRRRWRRWRRRGRRGGSAGAREAENARRGQLPSGGRREMQLSLRGRRRGHKWGRAGRSGAAGGARAGPRRPQTRSEARPPPREEGSGKGVEEAGGSGVGGGGTAGELERFPPSPCSPSAPAAVSPRWRAGARERGASVFPHRADCGASCPSLPPCLGTGAGKATPEMGRGDPSPWLGGEPKSWAGGPPPPPVRSAVAPLGPGRLGYGGGAAPGSQGSGKETQR